MTLRGQLEHFGLAELFQTLALNQHTGTLLVEHDGESKSIYFSTGSISFVSRGEGQTLRIGEILCREGKISEADIESAIAEQGQGGNLLGRILVDRGLITQDDVKMALRKKVQEELYDLFLWEEGSFEFQPDYCPSELMDPLQRNTQVAIDPQAILMEGLRQLDEIRMVKTHFPDFRVVVERSTDRLPDGALLNPGETTVWDLSEGQPTVGEILRGSEDTRFQTLRTLHRFTEEGWLRPLSFEGYVRLIESRIKQKQNDPAQEVIELLLDTNDEAGRDPNFLGIAGHFYCDHGQRDRGAQLLLESMRQYLAQGDEQRAWEVGFVVIRRGTKSVELLHSLWKLRHQGNAKQCELIWQGIVSRLEETAGHAEIEQFLANQELELGSAPVYWIRRAEACRRLDAKDNAVGYLETALGMLNEKRNLPDMIRVHRLIYDIDPSRSDIRKRLQDLLILDEKKAAKRSRKFSVVGAVSIVLMIAGIVPLRYELRARELFEQALLLENANAGSLDYNEARKLYGQITEKYRLSTKASSAEDRMLVIRKREIADRKAEENRIVKEQERERNLRLERTETAQELAIEAAAAEKAGNFEHARKCYEELLGDYAPLIDTERILFPLWINSTPGNAAIMIGEEEVGHTPYVHRFKPGTSFEIHLSRVGCVPQTVKHVDDGKVRLEVPLERSPIGEARMPMAVDSSPIVASGFLLVPCRDGWLYCFARSSIEVQEALWRRRSGYPGHPSAHVQAVSEFALVSSLSGVLDLVALADGQTVWSVQTPAPITAHAAVDADARYVAVGCEDGTILLVEMSTGETVGQRSGKYPISGLTFVDGHLRTVDLGRRYQEYSVPTLKAGKGESLPAAPSGFLSDGSLLLRDGSRPGSTNLPAPTTQLRSDRFGYSFGSFDGAWISSDNDVRRTGQIPVAVAHPPIRIGDLFYIGGANGRLYCAGLEGRINWSIALPGAISGVLPSSSDDLLVFLMDGRLFELQGGEE